MSCSHDDFSPSVAATHLVLILPVVRPNTTIDHASVSDSQ
jgi:hypothetical protein